MFGGLEPLWSNARDLNYSVSVSCHSEIPHSAIFKSFEYNCAKEINSEMKVSSLTLILNEVAIGSRAASRAQVLEVSSYK